MSIKNILGKLYKVFYIRHNPEYLDRPRIKPLLYLACPYSDPNPDVLRKRFEAVNKAAGKLMNEGYKVFSPISHTHPIAEACSLPIDWQYWESFDRAYLNYAHKIVVLKLDGWQESKGVKAEIAIAEELGLSVEYMDPV